MTAVVGFIVKTFVPIAGALFAEHMYAREKLPSLYASSSAFASTLAVPKAYGAVLLVNVIASGLLLVMLGLKVGSARSSFKEKALKDGDKDAEARFSYPKMYAEGFSEHAKKFNCVQRGHQHALETYTQLVVLSLVAGFKFPLATLIGGILWMYARIKWAEGYQTGEPSKRYQSWVSYGIWSSLLLITTAAIATAVMVMQ